MEGPEIDLGLDLLDRQLLDADGKLCGKVDDLELTIPDEGGAPIVTAIDSGPGALSNRLWGPLGRVAKSMWRRFHPELDPRPVRISFGAVRNVDYQVHLMVTSEDLGLEAFETWVTDNVIGRIPGS